MERMQSESIIEITKASIKAAKDFGDIPKNGTMPIAGKPRSYALLEDMLESVQPPLWDNGLYMRWIYESSDDEIRLTLLLTHESGEWVKSTCSTTVAGKKAADIGTWTTYMKRYQLMGILGVAPVEDVDGEDLNSFNTTTGGLKKSPNKSVSSAADKAKLAEELAKIKKELAALGPVAQEKADKHYGGTVDNATAKDLPKIWMSIERWKEERACAS